ncbi:MAG: hypothetical protein V7742_11670 [Halioglobus sp.]
MTKGKRRIPKNQPVRSTERRISSPYALGAYTALEVEDGVYFASWFEKGYGDYVTLLINFDSRLLYVSAILRGEEVHFHGARIVNMDNANEQAQHQ